MRLFLAIELPDSIKESLLGITGQMEAIEKGVKYVSSGGMHITLKFLGEVPEDKAEEIKVRVCALAQNYGKIHLYIEGLGQFPDRRKPRVFWAGVREEGGGGELASIASKLDELLIPLGFEKEKRELHAHVTLGRRKGEGRSGLDVFDLLGFADKNKSRRFGDFVADGIVLFQSILNPKGAVYNVIEKFPFSNT